MFDWLSKEPNFRKIWKSPWKCPLAWIEKLVPRERNVQRQKNLREGARFLRCRLIGRQGTRKKRNRFFQKNGVHDRPAQPTAAWLRHRKTARAAKGEKKKTETGQGGGCAKSGFHTKDRREKQSRKS